MLRESPTRVPMESADNETGTKLKLHEFGILDVSNIVKSVEPNTLAISSGFGMVRRGVLEYNPTETENMAEMPVVLRTLFALTHGEGDTQTRTVRAFLVHRSLND